MKDIYAEYSNEDNITVKKKDYYTEKDGFLNGRAFEDFVQRIDDTGYRLICLNVDLRKANVASYSFGNYTLRRFILSFQECFCFRIQGEKFNFIVPVEKMESVKNKLDEPKLKNSCEIYYGTVDEPVTKDNYKELIHKCVCYMYEDKHSKHNHKHKQDTVIGDKGNTPAKLQETTLCKKRETMWYSIARVMITKPTAKEFTLYIFPTELRKPMETLPTIAVVDDFLQYRVYYDSNIRFCVEGLWFIVNTRFDRDGHLNVAAYHSGEGQCEITTETHEGVCIPANFGKRVDNGEIYPIKENIFGLCDYVFLSNGKAEMNTEGVYVNGDEQYGVHMDDLHIDLIKQ